MPAYLTSKVTVLGALAAFQAFTLTAAADLTLGLPARGPLGNFSPCDNIYLYGIRGEGKTATHRAEAFMSQKRFDATKIHTHTFPLDDLPTAIRYAKDRVDDAIKVVVKAKGVAAHRVAAE